MPVHNTMSGVGVANATKGLLSLMAQKEAYERGVKRATLLAQQVQFEETARVNRLNQLQKQIENNEKLAYEKERNGLLKEKYDLDNENIQLKKEKQLHEALMDMENLVNKTKRVEQLAEGIDIKKNEVDLKERRVINEERKTDITERKFEQSKYEFEKTTEMKKDLLKLKEEAKDQKDYDNMSKQYNNLISQIFREDGKVSEKKRNRVLETVLSTKEALSQYKPDKKSEVVEDEKEVLINSIKEIYGGSISEEDERKLKNKNIKTIKLILDELKTSKK